MTDTPRSQLKKAIVSDDRNEIVRLLEGSGELRDSLDDPMFEWSKPPLAGARSIETAELLHRHGADYAKVGEWWAPGFFVRSVDPAVGRFLAEHGAQLTPHSAAGLGLTDELSAMLDADPAVIDAKGGDACTPLHFARDIPTAKLLIDRGARLDARDEDHDSTPAQWLIGDAPEVAKYLLERGATPDIFLAAALGDRALCERLIEANPAVLALRVGTAPFHPIGYQNLGGTILQWTLGFNSFAHQYAAAKGHDELVRYLFDESDAKTQFLAACVMAMRPEAEAIAAANPDLVGSLTDEDLELLARYCWETNANVEAVRLMLDVGFPIDHPETRHGWMPLHNAAWGGYGDLVDLLIERGHPLDLRDPGFGGTPIGWAIHCCCNEGRHPEGEYGRVVGALIDAGCPWDPPIYPTGDSRIDEAFEPRLRRRIDGAALLGDAEAVEGFLATTSAPATLTLALIGAAKGAHIAIVERLLAAGARINPEPQGTWSPIHAAAASGSVETLELLISRGADVTALNGHGSTALHFAAATGNGLPVLRALLRHGAGKAINVVNRYKQTPLDVSIEAGNEEAAEWLRENGGSKAEA